MMDAKQWGAHLKALRKDAEMTQVELANAAYLHKNAMTGYETGRVEPGRSVLVCLAKALGVDMNTLHGEEEEK
jgi:transcriptional regulator with XRE-family HTH domain